MQREVLNNQSINNFFIFINSGSGSGLGKKILSREIQQIRFRFDQKNSFADVYFYSLRDHRDKGFKKLREIIERGDKPAAIVCGGDGTVMWVVSQMINYNINPHMVPIGIIPVGTGNDFSQELGWGVQQDNLTQHSFTPLKQLVLQWQNASIQFFDLWDIHAQVSKIGKFEKVNKQQDINQLIEGKKLSRTICNYFSFGMDGKIGYSFDRHRRQSRLGNLAIYAMTKTKNLNQLVQSMEIRQDLSDDIAKQDKIIFHQAKNKGEIQFTTSFHQSKDKIKNKVVFESSIKTSKKELSNKIVLDKDYCNFLVLNVNSFMGGVKDIWANAAETKISQVHGSSSTSDGKVEIVSFETSVGLAAQRVFSGRADKIAQGSGPYYIKFQQYPNIPKHRTYLQLDGQFIRITHPKSLLIKKSELVPDGKIKVLRRKQVNK